MTVPATLKREPRAAAVIAARAPPTTWMRDRSSQDLFACSVSGSESGLGWRSCRWLQGQRYGAQAWWEARSSSWGVKWPDSGVLLSQRGKTPGRCQRPVTVMKTTAALLQLLAPSGMNRVTWPGEDVWVSVAMTVHPVAVSLGQPIGPMAEVQR